MATIASPEQSQAHAGLMIVVVSRARVEIGKRGLLLRADGHRSIEASLPVARSVAQGQQARLRRVSREKKTESRGTKPVQEMSQPFDFHGLERSTKGIGSEKTKPSSRTTERPTGLPGCRKHGGPSSQTRCSLRQSKSALTRQGGERLPDVPPVTQIQRRFDGEH
jgi:hypothetical protein